MDYNEIALEINADAYATNDSMFDLMERNCLVEFGELSLTKDCVKYMDDELRIEHFFDDVPESATDFRVCGLKGPAENLNASTTYEIKLVDMS